jgi:hypothetical protein
MSAVAWLTLLALSESGDVPSVWGDTLFELKGAEAAGTILFLIGAAMFYTILFRARLVPRWISAWGLVAIIPYIIPVFLGLFTNVDASRALTTGVLLYAPLGLQEMVLAVWLVVRGFGGGARVHATPAP